MDHSTAEEESALQLPNGSRTRQAGKERDLPLQRPSASPSPPSPPSGLPASPLAEAERFPDAGRLVWLRRLLLHDGGCGQIGPLGFGYLESLVSTPKPSSPE